MKHLTPQTMKSLTFLTLLIFPFLAFGQNFSKISKVTCKEIQKKREYREIVGKGILLHISCEDLTHLFFLLKEKTDSSGIHLNDSYTVRGKNLKLTSIGPKFFVVKRKTSPVKYQYTFDTSSWSFDEVTQPSWSTGNREDP